jgi:hypothetical protein
MATYKLSIVSKLGKFYLAFGTSSAPKVEPTQNPALGSVSEVVSELKKQIETKKLEGTSDTIIYRNIAYDDWELLSREVALSTF